jgi:signal transduction histidine kinase
MPTLLFFSTAWLGELKRRKYFLIANYAISLLFYVLAIITDKFISPYAIRKYLWGYYPIYTLWTVPFLVLFFTQIIITVRGLYTAYKREGVYFKKMSKKIILVASLIGFTAAVDFLPKLFNLPWLYPYGYISMLIYISLVAYAIARYRFMDITLTITRTGIFIAVYTLVLGLPFLLLTWGKSWLTQFLGLNWWAGPLVLLTVLATAGPFFYIYLQKRAEAILLREQLRYREALRQAAREMARIHNLKKLLNLIVHIVTKTVAINHSAIFLLDEKSGRYTLQAGRNLKKPQIAVLGEANPLIAWMHGHREPLVQEELRRKNEESADSLFKALEEQLQSLNAEVVVPGFLRDKLIGFLVLGDKRSGKIYNSEDLNTFSLLANQAALAVENAVLYENIEGQVKERTEELMQVQKQLVQAEKLATVGTLAGGVAHEINNPLTAVLTNVQMLLVDAAKIDPDTKESLQLIEEATKRCRTIVQKLMAYAKKPLETTEEKEVNMLELVEKVLDFLDYQMRQDNIKIILDAKRGDYPVLGNHNEMEQVLTNILINAKDAIKHHKKAGEIHISLTKNDDWVKVAIKDDGPGIPKNIISKIFDPFFTTKEIGKGLGLGLSICHSIVEKHNGTIKVESEPGKGSTFIVQLPRALAAKVA